MSWLFSSSGVVVVGGGGVVVVVVSVGGVVVAAVVVVVFVFGCERGCGGDGGGVFVVDYGLAFTGTPPLSGVGLPLG